MSATATSPASKGLDASNGKIQAPGRADIPENKKHITQRTPGDWVIDIIIWALVAFVIVSIIYPLWFVIIASVSNQTLVNNGQVLVLPKGFSWYGYEQIFQDSRIWTGYRNTILYAVVGTLLNLVITLPAAFALSRSEFRGRRLIMLFFTITMFVNGGLIPTYLLYKQVGLIDSWLVFIIPCAVNVYNLIIARSFFETSIPEELHDAAQIDGLGYFSYFVRIVLPLSSAIVAVIGLYYLVQHWNDFFTGLIYINTYEKQPLQMVLRDILLANSAFAGGSGSTAGAGYGQELADQIKYGVIIASTLPLLVIYPFIQKYFNKGVMIGAIKG
ncbi:carbohydrate ABC transporter permease [Bifidobacterium amazonense]|uniref:Carbohydrate ABC transporter permease n=1 Tax=Bifidobacterium amazonense TaxID=2809027 RepID=A0ABS9VY58_9BIFI|nr:carbohydrate ABC transporter permease [Bifidobacterium amazonense]MCH9276982.1 carbohydrate ABC transporter permease [Bifidobacterium amazonense]